MEENTDQPKLSSLKIASAVLECEALLMMSRAKFLQNDLRGFMVNLIEARCKVEALDNEVRQVKSEYFVAAPEVTHAD